MHLCPAVPQAEKAIPLIVKSKFAEGDTMAALLPPSSSKSFPSLAETIGANSLPISVLPVAETSAILLSLHMETASSFPPSKIKTKSEKSPLTLSQASLMPLAHSFACGLGFQIMLFPHTAAKQKFQAKTAIGKLNAVIHPTTPRGCHNS